MAEVKWIKLATDIFDNRKIKLIESMPEGDSIIVAWLKLLCLAGNINDEGMVYFTKEIPYKDSMLATLFRMPLTTMQLALSTFEQFGMIEVVDDIFHISNWEKYQNTDKLAELKEYNRLAQQKSRAKRKALKAARDVNDMSMTCQPCQGTDKEEDIDKEDMSTVEEVLTSKAVLSSADIQTDADVIELYKAKFGNRNTLAIGDLLEGYGRKSVAEAIDKTPPDVNNAAAYIGAILDIDYERCDGS